LKSLPRSLFVAWNTVCCPFALLETQNKAEKENVMKGTPTTIAEQILQVVRAHPGCGLDDLSERLPAVQRTAIDQADSWVLLTL
jgi:hypothetical protein